MRRPKSVKAIDSTMQLRWAGTLSKGNKYRFLFIFFLTACFCFSFYNQFLPCVSCCLLACVFDSVLIFRITDTFDLSILILDILDFFLIYFNINTHG